MSKPLNLIRRGEQLTLGGDAPAELIELSRFHVRAPRMQEQLRQLHDELNAPAVMQSAPTGHPSNLRPRWSKRPARHASRHPMGISYGARRPGRQHCRPRGNVIDNRFRIYMTYAN